MSQGWAGKKEVGRGHSQQGNHPLQRQRGLKVAAGAVTAGAMLGEARR